MTRASDHSGRVGRTTRPANAIVALGATALLLTSPSAFAARDDRRLAACMSSYEMGQELEEDGHLCEAQALYLECFRANCGATLEDQCLDKYASLVGEIPTVVPVVTDDAGKILVDVQVKVDGRPLMSPIDGRAFRIDPGAHQFTFATEHGVFATQNVLLLKGEHDRRIRVQMVVSRPTPHAPSAAAAPGTQSGRTMASLPPGGSGQSPSTAPSGAQAAAGAPAISPGAGVDAMLQIVSAYVFRGYNVFQSTSQHDQNMALLGRLIWDVPHTDLSLGYSTAYQLTGDNIAHNIEVGLGAEQVAFADYDWEIAPHSTVTPEIAVMIYPAAKDVPLFLEGSTEARYTGPIDASLYAGYFAALRSGPLSETHFYIRPQVEKAFDLTRHFKLSLEAEAGVKIFNTNLSAIHNNMFDVLANATVAYAMSSVISVSAAVGVAWTNLEARQDPDTGRTVTPTLGDEYVPIATLGVEGSW